MTQAIIENILIMLITIVVLLAGGYLLLKVIELGLKLKSGGREQQRLTDLWMANQAPTLPKTPEDPGSDEDPPPEQ
jgi:hypothetical protein